MNPLPPAAYIIKAKHYAPHCLRSLCNMSGAARGGEAGWVDKHCKTGPYGVLITSHHPLAATTFSDAPVHFSVITYVLLDDYLAIYVLRSNKRDVILRKTCTRDRCTLEDTEKRIISLWEYFWRYGFKYMHVERNCLCISAKDKPRIYDGGTVNI